MFNLLDLAFRDPRLFVVVAAALAVALILGLTFHEFSHALVADMQGDHAPRSAGRLSLNPRYHFDLVGTIMLLLAGFGWAKPVMVNPFRLKLGPRWGMVLVAVAGPLSNFLLAAALAVPLRGDWLLLRSTGVLNAWGIEQYLAFFLFSIVSINTTLGVFNLLPIWPLDGSRVTRLIPGELGNFFIRAEPYGIFILLLLMFLPRLTGGQFDIIGMIMNPIYNRLMAVFLGG